MGRIANRIPVMGSLIGVIAARKYIISAQRHVYSAVNSAMVTAYWSIGRSIYEIGGENDRALYGKQILEYISEELTAEFGKGYSVRNLRNMRRFYLMFQNRQTLSAELSWSHYQHLMRVEDERARKFYMEECVRSGWSVRQLQRQINTMYYHRILASRNKESVAAEIQATVALRKVRKTLDTTSVLLRLFLSADFFRLMIISHR